MMMDTFAPVRYPGGIQTLAAGLVSREDCLCHSLGSDGGGLRVYQVEKRGLRNAPPSLLSPSAGCCLPVCPLKPLPCSSPGNQTSSQRMVGTDGDLGLSSRGFWGRRVGILLLGTGACTHPCPSRAKSPFPGFSLLTGAQPESSGLTRLL